MKRRAERTYFNTEYMPELYEDSIESDDLQVEGCNTHGHLDDVLYADRSRFYKVCLKHGYDSQIIKNESRRKHPDF
ncbi:MAG: hypothetical protein IKB96_10985 [Prevotella sp.]|nr:hypothetical protein [Prevotella sp.]